MCKAQGFWKIPATLINGDVEMAEDKYRVTFNATYIHVGGRTVGDVANGFADRIGRLLKTHEIDVSSICIERVCDED